MNRESKYAPFLLNAMQTVQGIRDYHAAISRNNLFLPKKLQGEGGESEFIYLNQLAWEMNITLSQAIEYLKPFDGKLCIMGDLAKSQVLKSGLVTAWEESWSGSVEDESYTYTITARRGDLSPITYTFSIEDAINAGLYPDVDELKKIKASGKSAKEMGFWITMPKRMCYYRVLGFTCRGSFPDIVREHLYEEMIGGANDMGSNMNIVNDVVITRPKTTMKASASISAVERKLKEAPIITEKEVVQEVAGDLLAAIRGQADTSGRIEPLPVAGVATDVTTLKEQAKEDAITDVEVTDKSISDKEKIDKFNKESGATVTKERLGQDLLDTSKHPTPTPNEMESLEGKFENEGKKVNEENLDPVSLGLYKELLDTDESKRAKLLQVKTPKEIGLLAQFLGIDWKFYPTKNTNAKIIRLICAHYGGKDCYLKYVTEYGEAYNVASKYVAIGGLSIVEEAEVVVDDHRLAWIEELEPGETRRSFVPTQQIYVRLESEFGLNDEKVKASCENKNLYAKEHDEDNNPVIKYLNLEVLSREGNRDEILLIIEDNEV